MKTLLLALPLLLIACSSSDVGFIEGTATLPDCNDAPTIDLDGTRWYDNGTLTILDAGCPEAAVEDKLTVCALDWFFSQTGNDVEITVDNEYLIKGRLCGDKLHLKGGWWLPILEPGARGCTYEEDSAEEVAIEAEGNVLTVVTNEMSGTLVVKGRCRGSYSVTFNMK